MSWIPRVPMTAAAKDRFAITARNLSHRDVWGKWDAEFLGEVTDRKLQRTVHVTAPQDNETDARVAAGLWIERQERG